MESVNLASTLKAFCIIIAVWVAVVDNAWVGVFSFVYRKLCRVVVSVNQSMFHYVGSQKGHIKQPPTPPRKKQKTKQKPISFLF